MTIKEAAGKILLVLYYLQINEPVKLDQEQMVFRTTGKLKFETRTSKLKQMLHEVAADDTLLYNATQYLLERGLIDSKIKTNPMGALVIIGPHVTYQGVDIVESVEQGEEKQKVVKALFNFSFNFSPSMKVDSLLKAEVGNIVGIGGAIGGKMDV